MIQLNESLKIKLIKKDYNIKLAQEQMHEFLAVILESNGIDTKNIESVEYFPEEGKITYKEIENVSEGIS
jgi:hypothetical protein